MGNSSSQEGGTTSPRDNSESLSPSVSSAPSSEASASIQNHGSVLSPSSSLSSGSGKHHHHHLPHFPRHRPSVNIDTQSPRGPLSSNSPTSPISPALTGTRQDRRGSAGLNTTNFAGSATLNPTKAQQSVSNQTTSASYEDKYLSEAPSSDYSGFDTGSKHVEYVNSPSQNSNHVEYAEVPNHSTNVTQTHADSVPPQHSSTNQHSSSSSSSTTSKPLAMSSNNPNSVQPLVNSNAVQQQGEARPGPIRRKSTLLLDAEVENENEPEIDEDMDFNKLNIATGEPVGKPVSRAGSGDEIQLGDEEASEVKYDTVITWHQGGNKVYVTGSFTGWRKMIKLNKQADGTFSIILKLPVGTHRMRFVVDNELRCSDFLPSATDSMGNLVNYIEVPAESQKHHSQAQQQQAYYGQQESSAGIVDTAINDDSMEPIHRTANNNQHAQDDSKQLPPDYQAPFDSNSQHPKLQRANTVEKVSNYDMSNDDELLNGGGYVRFQEELPAAPVFTFTSEIPRVFTDPEVMEMFVASDFVTPPQLPPHLESVILNSNSNEKDNNSVLPIPNHVVLNHLATTSIKHNVLAVATISRYSRKYVTQILYAPL